MKKKIAILSLIVLGQCFSFAQTPTPALNKKIIEYINTIIGKKVDHGECWDLANKALRYTEAKWDGKYSFGKLLDPKKDTIYPGDIIQFEKVYVEYTKDNVQWKEQFPHHTAIVYAVLAKGDYKIAHQNSSFTGKKVGITELKLKDVKKGTLKFYRPTNN